MDTVRKVFSKSKDSRNNKAVKTQNSYIPQEQVTRESEMQPTDHSEVMKSHKSNPQLEPLQDQYKNLPESQRYVQPSGLSKYQLRSISNPSINKPPGEQGRN